MGRNARPRSSAPRLERYAPGLENRLDYTPPTGAIRPVLEITSLLERIFRFEVQHFERLLACGPAVVVANHGILPVEMFMLGARYFKETGRIFRGITDPRTFKAPLLRDLWTTLGVVDGTADNAVALLERGEKIMIMPGGGREAFKPTRQRYKIRWEGRAGVARIAIRAKVPIIPVTCVGVDHMYYVANDAYRFEKLFREWLGTKLIPISIFFGLGPFPFPAKLTQTVGEPIFLDEPESTLHDAKRLATLQAKVAGTMQSMLDEALKT
jgi:1-acyl-sn-glycerol-3-phosphate acyltransferase